MRHYLLLLAAQGDEVHHFLPTTRPAYGRAAKKPENISISLGDTQLRFLYLLLKNVQLDCILLKQQRDERSVPAPDTGSKWDERCRLGLHAVRRARAHGHLDGVRKVASCQRVSRLYERYGPSRGCESVIAKPASTFVTAQTPQAKPKNDRKSCGSHKYLRSNR